MKILKRLLCAAVSAAVVFSYIPSAPNAARAEEAAGAVPAADTDTDAYADGRDTLLRLTDSISYSSREFTSMQEGELYFTRYNQWTNISATNDEISVRHERHADWGSNFYIDGSLADASKKTVAQVKFRIELEDPGAAVKPKAKLRFYHNGGKFHAETAAFVPEGGKEYTVRFVLDPDTNWVYTSFDGGTYKTSPLGSADGEVYGKEMRIYPVALAAADGAADAVTPLETPMTFIFDEFYIYQTDGARPSETEDIEPVVTEEQAAELDMLRERWKEYLTGGGSDGSDAAVAEKAAGINASAQYHWDRMNKEAGRTFLFSDVTDLGASSHIRSNYNYLLIMAKAYATPGCALYENAQLAADIVSALDWMYENEYNENTERYDNWWEWEIGVPQALNNIIVLMYDVLSAERIEKYERAVNHFSPDPRRCCLPNNFVSTAANRLSMCFVVGLRGIIIKDPARVKLAGESLDEVFGYVTSGDGFYSDGSFIQHDRHPYNGGYGLGMVHDLSMMIYLLGGSSYEVTDEERDNIYDWIYKGYVPLIYHGIMMDAVTGRSGSRSYNSTYCAVTILKAVLMLADEADGDDAARLKSIAKAWISENTLGNLYTDSNTEISTIKMMNSVMADSSVSPAEVREGNYQYPGMDRVVHNREDWSFAVSMYSDRIYNFESILGENLKGWHTADGMTYLYNSDTSQYTDAFWPTVDPYRLAGTTAADTVFSDGEGANSLSGESMAGGVSLDGMYGLACMELDAYGSDLTAKKSWFMFDDEVAALGSDIECSDGSEVETIIDNRKLGKQGANAVTADGKAAVTGMGVPEKLENVGWIHLEGEEDGSDVGYYLFGGADVTALRESRSGSWRDVNVSNAVTYDTNCYLSLGIDHGADPQGAGYAYALLPGKSARETEQFAEDPTIEIIRNDAAVHAVSHTGLGITGAVFWTDSEESAGKLSCSAAAAVMARESGGELVISVSDPSQSKNGTVEITYDGAAEDIISCGSGVEVISLYPKVRISADVSGTRGSSLSVRLKKADESPVRISSFTADRTEGGIGYTAEVVNVSAGAEAAASVIAAAYTPGGMLVGSSVHDISVPADGASISCSGLIETDSEEKLTVKVFIWNSMDGMIPYDKTEETLEE